MCSIILLNHTHTRPALNETSYIARSAYTTSYIARSAYTTSYIARSAYTTSYTLNHLHDKLYALYPHAYKTTQTHDV